ncbi:hypothetical protein HAV15_012228 [Penicillium sp. str. |nr:hypothetical protein HAV15_012228 [Penicillium sp. str. \
MIRDVGLNPRKFCEKAKQLPVAGVHCVPEGRTTGIIKRFGSNVFPWILAASRSAVSPLLSRALMLTFFVLQQNFDRRHIVVNHSKVEKSMPTLICDVHVGMWIAEERLQDLVLSIFHSHHDWSLVVPIWKVDAYREPPHHVLDEAALALYDGPGEYTWGPARARGEHMVMLYLQIVHLQPVFF